MATDPKDTSWKVQGRKFNSNTPEKPDDDQELKIPQTKLCVQMPGYEDKPLGRPIDANLAVNLISNFLHHIKMVYHPTPSNTFEEFLNKSENEEFSAFVKNTRDFHRKVLELNYGMSVDKNMLLKVLSQPGCEGVRYYLCYRPDVEKISLVMVGIDCEGCDLNYTLTTDTVTYYKDGETGTIVPPRSGAKSIENVKMQSLTGEYVTPPYTIIDFVSWFSDERISSLKSDFNKEDIDKCFVLMNFANS